MKRLFVKFTFVFSLILLVGFLIFSIVGLGNTVFSTVEMETKASSVDLNQSWSRKVRDFNVEEGEGAKEVTALLYHRIIEDSELGNSCYGDRKLISTILPSSQFEKELKYLKDNDYTVLTSLELEKFMDGEIEVPKNSVLITFDDSRKEDYEVAYNLLKKYGFTAVNFAITGEITKFNPSYDLEQCLYMSKSNLEKSDDVFEFQSHTDDMHGEEKTFLNSSKEEIIKDLNKSYEFLNTSRKLFAYPRSEYNEAVKEALKEVGVSMAFIIGESKINHDTDKLEIPRYSITPDLELDDFIYLVKEE